MSTTVEVVRDFIIRKKFKKCLVTRYQGTIIVGFTKNKIETFQRPKRWKIKINSKSVKVYTTQCGWISRLSHRTTLKNT